MTDVTAGRELDAEIAVKVFGWRHVHGTPAGLLYGQNPALDHIQTPRDRARGIRRSIVVPRYSVSEAEAGLVVDRLTASGATFRLNGGAFGWTAEFDLGGPTFSANATTRALSICLAALASLTPEGPE